MSDKEMISKAFSSLKAPEDTLERIHEKMNKKRENRGVFIHKKASLLLAAVLVLALGTAGVYAAKTFNLGKVFAKGEILNSEGTAVKEQDGFLITAPFAKENPVTGYVHDGIDFMAEEGTPVLAAAKGKVLTAEFDVQKGYYIVIAHEEGYSTLYAHLKELKVSQGDLVNQGDEIGTVGKTGQATGAHLHLQLLKDGQPVNPEDYWEQPEE